MKKLTKIDVHEHFIVYMHDNISHRYLMCILL